MRPPGPVPGTLAMSMPSSRAYRRTEGAAGTGEDDSAGSALAAAATSARAGAGAGRPDVMSTTGAGLDFGGSGLAAGASLGGASAAGAAWAAGTSARAAFAAGASADLAPEASAEGAPSITSTTWPTFTLSPAF